MHGTTLYKSVARKRGRGQKILGFTFFEETEESPKYNESREYFQVGAGSII